jgi:hypothetical protein
MDDLHAQTQTQREREEERERQPPYTKLNKIKEKK